MKKVFSLFVVIAVLAISATACAGGNAINASKNYVTKKVNVGSFDAISTSTSINVIYTQTSGGRSVEIYAPDNLMEYVNVRVDKGTLKVGYKDVPNGLNILGKRTVEVRVAAPGVHRFSASSSGNILLKSDLQTSGSLFMKTSSSGDIKGGKVSCDELTVSASSSGDITLGKVKCENLSASTSSSGDVTIKNISAVTVDAKTSSAGDIILSGSCQSAMYSASSSGDLEAHDLKAENVVAKANSAGDISCYVSNSLKASASSSGEVAYKGNPTNIEFSSRKGLRRMD